MYYLSLPKDPYVADRATALRALALVDLTNLNETCSDRDIDELCRRAVGPFGSTVAVCVWPRFVSQAARRLAGSGVLVASVVNFPAGDSDISSTVAETKSAIAHGADEIDLVLPYHAFLAGQTEVAAAMVDEVRAAVDSPLKLKVILETGGYPSLDSIRDAARFVIHHGTDFIKTSTGKTSVSATLAASVMILDAIRDADHAVGIKASGGIKTLDDAARYLALTDEMMGPDWATPATFRFGASGLLNALEDAATAPSHADSSGSGS
jgi:deoxyribose-phosphate aldolase